MAITVTLYDTATLLGVFKELYPPTSYWLDLGFPQEINSDNEFIDMEKVFGTRKIAPFVAPLAQGKPIYTEGGVVTRLRPAYSKMKDAVTPTRVIKRRPGTLLPIGNQQSAGARWNSLIADIAQTHVTAANRLWEWMAARALIDATVTITGDDYPERVVDFARDAGQTVTLAPGAQWGDAGVSIIGLIESWRSTMRIAHYGGVPNRITMGAAAWDIARNDPEIRFLMSTLVRQTSGTELNLGMLASTIPAEFVGQLSRTLDVYVYTDFYQDTTGAHVPFMSENDIVLTAPNVDGVRCFGAILNPYANFQPLSLFPRMYIEDDPAVTFVMTETSPLMVPVNPNATLKATVTS